MSIPIKRSCALLLAFPLIAVAAPVAVTTHSTGVHRTNDYSLGATDSLLNVLGLDPLTSTAPVPYALTLTSTFDTDALPSPESFLAQADGDVVIDFRIGSQAYHYAGPANSTAYLAAQSANVEEYSPAVSRSWTRRARSCSVSALIMPVRSASGMKADGGNSVPSGRRQRASASAPTTSLVTREHFG